MLAALAAAAQLLAGSAWADDRSAGVAPGAFRVEPAGGARPDTVGIVLDGEQVALSLGLTARAKTAIRIDFPRFEWLGDGETYPTRQFPELKVEVDGRAVAPAEDFVAAVRGRDITDALKVAGVDPFSIADTPPLVVPLPRNRSAFDALVASGAVAKVPEGFVARWSAARIVRVVPGAGAHLVTFRYTARPAFALGTLASAGVRWAKYCTTQAAVTRELARHGQHGGVVTRTYVIPVVLGGVSPRTIALRVPRQAGTTTIVCGADGTAVFDPVGNVTVKAGKDGAVHMLRISPPG